MIVSPPAPPLTFSMPLSVSVPSPVLLFVSRFTVTPDVGPPFPGTSKASVSLLAPPAIVSLPAEP